MEEFVLLPMVLKCSLKDLVAHDELIQVTDTALLPASVIRSLVVDDGSAKNTWDSDAHFIPALEAELDGKVKEAVWRAHFVPSLLSYLLVRDGSQEEAARKAAITLQARPTEVAAYALRCWGRSLTEERDARAAEQASNHKEARAVRGHITRALLDCIKKERLASNNRRRNETPTRLPALTERERDLNRILIENYETDERLRKRARTLYEEWMLFKMFQEAAGEVPKPRNEPKRGDSPTTRAARTKAKSKK
jgi:hypothetical protein